MRYRQCILVAGQARLVTHLPERAGGIAIQAGARVHLRDYPGRCWTVAAVGIDSVPESAAHDMAHAHTRWRDATDV